MIRIKTGDKFKAVNKETGIVLWGMAYYVTENQVYFSSRRADFLNAGYWDFTPLEIIDGTISRLHKTVVGCSKLKVIFENDDIFVTETLDDQPTRVVWDKAVFDKRMPVVEIDGKIYDLEKVKDRIKELDHLE